MKVNREDLLNNLNMVKAGLSPREFIEQSSCFVFQDGSVMTFNDEVACRKEIGFQFKGAVQAAPLLAILEKMDDPELEVLENEKGELEFRGKGRRFGVLKDAEIFLPIDRVEMPEKWRALPKEFTEAIGLVQHCVSQDESRFLLTCIHIAPEWIEACDNMQMMRCPVDTGLKGSVLVRGTSLQHLVALGMDQMALTKNWVHFQNQLGLVFSCRRYAEQYPDLEAILKFEGSPIIIPKGMADASDRAAVFASDKSGEALVLVRLAEGRVQVVGDGVTGWYKEIKKVSYDGPPLEFLIAPELLKHIAERYSDAELTGDKLKVKGGSWVYVTVLGKKTNEEEQPAEEPKKKAKQKDADPDL